MHHGQTMLRAGAPDEARAARARWAITRAHKSHIAEVIADVKVEESHEGIVLVFAPPQAQSVASALGVRWEVSAAFKFARSLTTCLAEGHSRGLLHLGLRPDLVWTREFVASHLLPFGLQISDKGHEYGRSYLAPEQVAGLDVLDERTDLYALGSIIYHALSGRPLFWDTSGHEMAHASIARVPAPLAAINKAVPLAFSDIVTRLLNKRPDARYQSAQGLLIDLQRAESLLLRGEHDGRFPLGQRDHTLRLRPMTEVHGRSEERAQIVATLERAERGESLLTLISGGPGIGKTSLAQDVCHQAGRWCVGRAKFARGETPESVIERALQMALRTLLRESDSVVGDLRRRLRASPFADVWAKALPDLTGLEDTEERARSFRL